MNRSESITKLSIALAKFNSQISIIQKDAKNPFFKSNYVTLDKLIEDTRDLLQKQGLSVMQIPVSKEGGEIGIQTILLHESGEYIESEPLYMKPVKNDPQTAGSLITYLRRYSYQAILNLSTGEDDDGNRATYGNGNPELTENQIKRLYAIGNKAGITPHQIIEVAKREYNKVDLKKLTKAEYDAFCERLERKAGEWFINSQLEK